MSLSGCVSAPKVLIYSYDTELDFETLKGVFFEKGEDVVLQLRFGLMLGYVKHLGMLLRLWVGASIILVGVLKNIL